MARGVSVICAVGLCVAARAGAEPRDAALRWRAPVDCPDAGAVRARIERRLGASIDGVVRGVAVDVTDRGAGVVPRFVARIDLRGDAAPADEVRVLSSARCDELADAVAVVVARLAAERRSPARPEPARPAPSELRLDRPIDLRDATLSIDLREPRAPAPWGADLRVVGVSGIGAQPGVSVGGELTATLRRRSAIVELAGMQWLSSTRTLHAGDTGGLDIDLRLAALRLGWGSEQLPLRAWLSGELGTLRGTVPGSIEPRVETARWIAAGAGFAVAWPMGPYARLVGAIELAVPVQAVRILPQDNGEMYRSAMVTVRSGFGLEIGWL
ncbi:MAG TPA: hypothetical protein VHW23_01215 [Kofleriaceae bacterium]|jgi:hypothetical protein|nr:hypothetical protein [Kofleriaceae bacterium]